MLFRDNCLKLIYFSEKLLSIYYLKKGVICSVGKTLPKDGNGRKRAEKKVL